jgi:hypothetical protein
MIQPQAQAAKFRTRGKMGDCAICCAPILLGMPCSLSEDDQPVHQACGEQEAIMVAKHRIEAGLDGREAYSWLQ